MGMIYRPSGIYWTTLTVIAMKAKKVAISTNQPTSHLKSLNIMSEI
jgi:hypothetical protein